LRLAFAIFRYFPFGGLQRDMLSMAQEARVRGHQVTVFCGEWEGDKPKDIEVVIVESRSWFGNVKSNHLKNNNVKSFVHNFEQIYQSNNFDLLIGFNKMPNLDVYFAGDSCFAQKAYEERNWLYRLTPRARLYLHYEKAVFDSLSKTHILSIADAECKCFARYYGTVKSRFHTLPPGISRAQFFCQEPLLARKKIRTELGVDDHTKIILCLGSGFKTKGLDRSIAAFSQLQNGSVSNYALIVVGADSLRRYAAQAQRLGVGKQVIFLGGRKDIADILQAADVLFHPAYRELAGNVILEAMLAGKPVITTDVCGFAHYVAEHNMGLVISAPYSLEQIVTALHKVLQINASLWQSRAQEFAATADVFSRQVQALNTLEKIVEQKRSPTLSEVASEWVEESTQQIVILRDELIKQWAQQNVLSEVQKLSGSVAREFADRQTLRFELAGNAYYRKLHRGVGWREIVKNLIQLRWPILGAKNEWLALNKLRALSIPTLEPVAYGEHKKSIAKKISFIVTRELAGVVQLDHYFQQHSIDFKEKLVLLRKVAEIARALHSAGINHRDFYLCHFMLDLESIAQWRQGGVEPKIYIVDLHRAQLRHEVPRRWQIKDLSGLYFSSFNLGFTRYDYLRFMRTYWQLPLRTLFATDMPLLKAIEYRAIKTYKRDFGVAPIGVTAIRALASSQMNNVRKLNDI
jgi:UDP-glucose:(heptosyl)LPS alpha-1,3-glucosyltransferase